MKSFKEVDKLGTIHYKNRRGEWHREDGPAVEYSNGTKSWYIKNMRHREDGPAIVWSIGEEWYYLNGFKYSKEDWEKEVIRIKLERIKDL